MTYKAENRKYLDTLRMTDNELAVVVSEELCRNSAERRWMRRSTNFMRMIIDVFQPGGTIGKFIVRSYDLSEGGIGFFTGNYIHASTRCRLSITTIDGESLSIEGTIAHCKNVWGHVHFAGVEFDTPIDLSWFEDDDAGSRNNSIENLDEKTNGTIDSNPQSVQSILAIVDELRELITRKQLPDEIRACIERIESALKLNGEAPADPDEAQDGNELAEEVRGQIEVEFGQITEIVPPSPRVSLPN